MKQKIQLFALFSIAVVFLLAGCTNGLPNPPGPDTVARTATVTITASGYEPQTVTIAKGGTVTWTNTTNTSNRPATAMHPTHLNYPGSDIQKCGTGEQRTIFDACRNLLNGESYAFKFDETGEWPYHDHVEAKIFGKVIVVG